jgi:hypothetical protein
MPAKRRRSRSEAGSFVAQLGRAVDRGADAAESIHRKAARLPLVPFEGVEALEGTLHEVERLQRRLIGAIYGFVRDVNHELVQIAEEALANVEGTRKRSPARPRRRPAAAAPRAA